MLALQFALCWRPVCLAALRRKVGLVYNQGRFLKLNYLDGPQVASGYWDVEESWVVSAAGYAKDTDVPWHAVREQITSVEVNPSFKGVSFPDISHWFRGMTSLMNVSGFDNISGVNKANQTFSGDSELRSIWCESPYAPSIASASIPFYDCCKLVGGHLTVATDTAGTSAFTTGANGPLACSADDEHSWASRTSTRTAPSWSTVPACETATAPSPPRGRSARTRGTRRSGPCRGTACATPSRA